MAGRHSVRLLSRQLASQCSHSRPHSHRTFSSTFPSLEPHNFMMPAMSPTMTEGNISSWKVREGEAFSAGDILLEIETDKASMDVEAQEDGVMAKIFEDDGAKAVKVGTRIAVLADPGDDISSLEIPADDSKPVQSEADKAKAREDSKYVSSGVEEQSNGTPESQKPAKEKAKPSLAGPGQNPKYPLYPSVIALIHENKISDEDVAKIPATGPNNRLLKGDVLSYLGTIESDYSVQQSKRIERLAHLDLSNIKILPTAPKPAAQVPAAGPSSELPKATSVSITISLAEVLKVQKRIKDTLGVTVPLSTFLARAVDLANDDLPNPKGMRPSTDDLFDAILGLNSIPTTSRGNYLPQIDAFHVLPTRSALTLSKPRLSAKRPDLIDILSGKTASRRSTSLSGLSASAGRHLTTTDGALNTFRLTVPASEDKRARTFLERVKTVLQVEPGKLVL